MHNVLNHLILWRAINVESSPIDITCRIYIREIMY